MILEKIVMGFPWKKWRFFLVRFSRKIEGDFWFFYKRFLFIFFGREAAPALVLHVLAKAFTREKPSALADDLHLLQDRNRRFWLWKWKSESESIFGPLNFFIFRYVEGGVLGNNYISIKKCTTTFLWVLNFGEVGEILENFQKHPLGESFWKMVSKVIFWKNYNGISL